jgi:hypothetical protein
LARSTIISSTLNIEEVYERFAEEVLKLVRFDRLAINVINPKDYTLTVLISQELTLNNVGRDLSYLAGSFTEEVAVTRSNITSWETLKGYLDRFPDFCIA